MKKIIVELSNERLITPSGLSLVRGALGKSDLVKRANRVKIDNKRSQPQFKKQRYPPYLYRSSLSGKPSFEAVCMNCMLTRITKNRPGDLLCGPFRRDYSTEDGSYREHAQG